MTVQRFHTGPRMSQAVVHGNTIYLAGQVGEPTSDVTNQTKECLAKVDALLAECGASKENILSTTIWLADMADFAKMNEVWDAWVPQGHTPARACGEAKLATPDYLVEFIVVAAKP
ncbi:RidA family protein [Thalassospira australica]|uniref:RidA family protein n=1 Tax=Thalassospira australica TaxID=1528106 RepID=UPI00384AB29C